MQAIFSHSKQRWQVALEHQGHLVGVIYGHTAEEAEARAALAGYALRYMSSDSAVLAARLLDAAKASEPSKV